MSRQKNLFQPLHCFHSSSLEWDVTNVFISRLSVSLLLERDHKQLDRQNCTDLQFDCTDVQFDCTYVQLDNKQLYFLTVNLHFDPVHMCMSTNKGGISLLYKCTCQRQVSVFPYCKSVLVDPKELHFLTVYMYMFSQTVVFPHTTDINVKPKDCLSSLYIFTFVP